MENQLQATTYYGPNIWKAIWTLRVMNESIWVASPFIGEGAKFNWAIGDSLLVALSEKNVRDGSVSPFVLEEVINKGVKVFSNERLHAKIYSNGKQAIICSCNMSYASQYHWLEAGVLITDKLNLDGVRRFFEDNLIPTNLVSLEKLAYYKNIFRKGANEISEHKNEMQEEENSKIEEDVWSVFLVDREALDESSEKKIQDSCRTVQIQKDSLSYYFFSSDVEKFKVGDYIIRFMNIGDKVHVFFPARCIEVIKINENRYGVHIAHKSGYTSIQWDTVEHLFSDLDLKPNTQRISQKQKVLERLCFYFLP